MKRNSMFVLLGVVVAFLFVFNGCSSSDVSGNQSDGDVETADGDLDSDTEVETDEYPDNNFIYEVKDHPDDPPTEDSTYLAEETTYYRTTDKLPNTDVKFIRNINGKIYAVSDDKLMKYDSENDMFVAVNLLGNDNLQAISHTDSNDGCIYIGYSNYIEMLCSDSDATEIISDDDLDLDDGETITALDADSDIYIGTNVALYKLTKDDQEWDISVVVSEPVNDLASLGSGKLIVAFQNRLAIVDSTDDSADTVGDLLSEFNAVAVCPDGKWIAGSADSFVYNSGESLSDAEVMVPELGGLPEADIISVACDDEWMFMGHEIGATALKRDLSHKDHYVALRWMLDNRANSVALSNNGARWIATSAGITRIDFVQRTAFEKAQIMHNDLDDYYWRMDGFVSAEVYSSTPWSMDGLRKVDSDNDGLWTQMMIGAFAFAYGVTQNSYYCDEARKAINVMMMQIDIPCESFKAAGKECGFVTRSLVRDDEGDIFTEKASQDNWHLVEYKGHQYYWKDDTSSDETTGHFFGYPLYFDFCATDDEKQDIAEHVGKLASYIVDNGFYLIDLDGEKTKFGHWAPEWIGICVNGIADCLDTADDPGLCFSACYGGGWLNSLQILGYMLAAWHITGDKKFYDAYDMLITKYHYDKIASFSENVYTCTRRNFQNHSDHELAILAYHTLIRYEPNEDRRQMWIDSLLGFYNTELPERNPLWAAFVAGLAGKDYDKENAIRTIREMPLDRRYWRFDNTHRQDYEVDRKKGRHDELQFTDVVPYDEMRTMWWNGNPYAVITGGNSNEIVGPMAYLLAYWSMRYYGLLGEPVQR